MNSRLQKYNSINTALMNWNPLSVSGPALFDEYQGLIAQILNQKDVFELRVFLTKMLSDKYGIELQEFDDFEQMKFEIFIEEVRIVLW